MTKKREMQPIEKTPHGHTQVVGFRITHSLAAAIKVEAAKRQMPLNRLLAEMWKLYSEAKRAG